MVTTAAVNRVLYIFLTLLELGLHITAHITGEITLSLQHIFINGNKNYINYKHIRIGLRVAGLYALNTDTHCQPLGPLQTSILSLLQTDTLNTIGSAAHRNHGKKPVNVMEIKDHVLNEQTHLVSSFFPPKARG